jgi:arginyl-tRNA synthetase
MAQNRGDGADYLAQLALDLAMDNVTNSYPAAHPDINLLDAYRAHLSTVLAPITGVDKTIIYGALMWTQSLDKGDYILAVPALRIKGNTPAGLATSWQKQVRFLNYLMSDA